MCVPQEKLRFQKGGKWGLTGYFLDAVCEPILNIYKCINMLLNPGVLV
jgi:hypothetical protein